MLFTNWGDIAVHQLDPRADFNGDGKVNVQDLLYLLSKWQACKLWCPHRPVATMFPSSAHAGPAPQPPSALVGTRSRSRTRSSHTKRPRTRTRSPHLPASGDRVQSPGRGDHSPLMCRFGQCANAHDRDLRPGSRPEPTPSGERSDPPHKRRTPAPGPSPLQTPDPEPRTPDPRPRPRNPFIPVRHALPAAPRASDLPAGC